MSKLTIPRNLPKDHPRGDFRARCVYCGTVWMRSKLRLDGSGMLFCPDEGDGRDKVTLDNLNANAIPRNKRNKTFDRAGGGGDANTLDIIQRTTYDDIFRY